MSLQPLARAVIDLVKSDTTSMLLDASLTDLGSSRGGRLSQSRPRTLPSSDSGAAAQIEDRSNAWSRSVIAGFDRYPLMGAKITIARFQGATFRVEALKGESGFARSYAVTNNDLSLGLRSLFGGSPGTRTRDHRIKSPVRGLFTTICINCTQHPTTR